MPGQDSLGRATDVLVSFLPEHPPESTDRYATNALREFATRNVLSLITIMWEAEEFAKRAKAWRMPHVLRVLVTHRRTAVHGGTPQQEILREFVVEQALTAALLHRRTENRNKLVTELLNLRDEKPFKQIREVLNQEHLLLVEPSPKREQNARRVYKELKALIGANSLQLDHVQLAHNSTLRALHTGSGGFTAKEYEFELHRVFPELKPQPNDGI